MAAAAGKGGGGEATLWEAVPNTVAEDRALVEEFRAPREEAYRELIDAAHQAQAKGRAGGDSRRLSKSSSRLERDFRTERRRDYFRSPLRKVADRASARRGAR